MTWRGRLRLAAALALVAATAFFGIRWWTDRWHEAPITGPRAVHVVSDDGRLLQLNAGRCNAELRLTVEETATQVRVLVEERHGTMDDCGNSVMVGLYSPLGDREVVDRSTGSVVGGVRP